MRRQPPDQPSDQQAPAARRRPGLRWLITGAASILGHSAVVVALVWAGPNRIAAPDPAPMTVAFVELPPPPPPAPPAPPVKVPTPPRATRAKPVPRRMVVHRAPVRANVPTLPVTPSTVADTSYELSEGQLAGAASADGGPPGGACDMARRLQAALRKDPLVHAALAGSAGKAIMIWNGDWIRNGGEDGKGLAAVREAILWEVGFAPKACRAEPVRGLVLLSLGPNRGAVRVAVGTSAWRWSDLLTPRREISDDATSMR